MGQLCGTHGAHDQGVDLDEMIGERGFAGILAGAGYDMGFFGKAHFSSYDARKPTGRSESVLSSVDLDADWFGPFIGFSHVEPMLSGPSNHRPPPQGMHWERFVYEDECGDERTALYLTAHGETKGPA